MLDEPRKRPKKSATQSARVTFDQASRALLTRFWRDWVSHRWRQLVVAFVLMSVVAATTGAYSLIIKYSYDKLINGTSGVLPFILLAIVGASSMRALFLYLSTVQTNKIVMRTTTDLQKEAFAHVISSDYARITRDSPGHLVSRLTNDMTLIQQASQAVLTTAVRDVLTVIALVASMIHLDWVMSLIVLGLYPIAALPIARIGQRLRQVAKRTQAELADMTSALTENFSGARLIKTYQLEAFATGRLNANFEEINRLRLKAVRARARIDPMLEVLGGLAVSGVMAVAYWRIVGGQSTVGDFMGFISSLLLAAQPIRALGNLNSKVQEGLAAVQRTFELLDERPEIVDLRDAQPLQIERGAIVFEHVSFAYGETKTDTSRAGLDLDPDVHHQAVRDLSLTVPSGQTVALVGRSGAGKSTIINLVPRLFDPQLGRILIDGQDIAKVTTASLRGAIAIVSQDITLFNDTVRANIAMGRLAATDAQIEAAAIAAAAHGFISALPNGFATMIGDRGMRLSGGQRQRLALARAILKDAPILLLDEATSALDTESERLVQSALAQFSRNRTTLVIAHRLSTVQSADLICVLDDGRLIEQGRHTDLIARNGVYAGLCRSQLLTAGEASAPQVQAAQ